MGLEQKGRFPCVIPVLFFHNEVFNWLLFVAALVRPFLG